MESFPYIVKYKKGKENVVADALSCKNTNLLTQLEVNVLGLDDIKSLYASDPFFGPIFAQCSIDKGIDDFYLHKGFLFKQNKLCIPKSSLQLLLIQESCYGVNPGVGPIFHEFHEKRGGIGGRRMKLRKAMKTTNTHTPKHDTRLLLMPVATGPT